MTVRNNEERLGAKMPDASPPIPSAQEQGPPPSTFSFVVPTEFVELPSRGKYYPEGHPLHNEEVVEVKHMTAKEEDLLTSKSLLKKGLAINRVLQSVLVDQKINVDSLLVGDKNAILIATRIFAYGADYQTNVSCPSCGTNTQHSFNLEDLEVQEGHLTEGVVKKGDNFVIHLPKTKVDVEVRLLNGQDERFLANAMNMKRKHNLPDSTLTDQLRLFIVSVNEYSDPQSITTFIEGMPASDSRYLRTTYEKLVPNIDMTQNFICNNCDYDAEMEVPLSADFFWPKQ